MPLDVIMPALGMAQDTGLIIAWHKEQGDAIKEGDILFEVETDKATMEVEAQGSGFLTDVSAAAGSDVPVGSVIARISESAKTVAPVPAPHAPAARTEDLPEGKPAIMPTLGMAQDSGLLVRWHRDAGDAVSADDALFEVETDKSTVEVAAGFDGFVAAILAEAGEEVPVGQVIAIISPNAPANPVTRSARTAPPQAGAPVLTPTTTKDPAKAAHPPKVAPQSGSSPAMGGRILASPKVRRLAREQGLDLSLLAKAGHPQPFHVKDLNILKALPPETETRSAAMLCRLTAELAQDGFAGFAIWAAQHAGLSDESTLLAGLCAASLGQPTTVSVEQFGQSARFDATTHLGATSPSENAATLRLRDLRLTPIASVNVGDADIPTLTITRANAGPAPATGLTITLEYPSGQMTAQEAISLLSNFAGRMEHPLRHLL